MRIRSGQKELRVVVPGEVGSIRKKHDGVGERVRGPSYRCNLVGRDVEKGERGLDNLNRRIFIVIVIAIVIAQYCLQINGISNPQ